MQIRDNGKPYRLYFATDAVVQYSLPGDYDATGKTFSLAVRTERNVNTPALAEATGTVTGQIVMFTVDTNTQTFLDAVQSGISTAWLEIYVGDTDVLLQRPVSIEPRAGSLEGQPPAPVVLYYTAAEVDTLLAGKEAAGTAAAAVEAHNTSADAHPNTFDAAGTAATEVEYHNQQPDAHQGQLLPLHPEGADFQLVTTANSWEWRFGEKMQTVAAGNNYLTGSPGAIFKVALTANRTLYIAPGATGDEPTSDFDFGLVVTQGTTAYSLTLYAADDLAYSLLFPDDNVPPRYAAGNTPPAISTANTAYMFRFHWDAANSVLLANLAYAVEVTQ